MAIREIIKGSRGISLVEILMVIVVMAIAIPPLISFIGSGTVKIVDSERRMVALGLAQGLMEEIKSQHYDEKAAPPYSYPLGPDTGENAGDKATFDDMDDYDGWQESSRGFTLSVTVFYVDPADLNTMVPSETLHKRIAVQVHDTYGTIDDFSLVTLVAA
ncbi:MAG: type II secretion system protein [Deltaproteobacteria bacterium]|nr:MAG: type II secretion system protein [Deltaproteobacteria bacterium]